MHNSIKLKKVSSRYVTAIGLAVAAQVANIPFHVAASISFITYAPFIIFSAFLGGVGPGHLTTVLCVIEAIYLSFELNGTLMVWNRANWFGVGALTFTGIVASILVERLQKAGRQLTEAHSRTIAILESISDGFNTLDREWRYTYVNAAAAKMFGKTPEELLGKNLWEMCPQAADLPFGVAIRRSVTDNVPVQVEAYHSEPLNAWFEVRCYPSPEGLSVFLSDTTVRRRAEENSRLLSSIVESSDDAILSKNLDGIILTWNKGAERIYGYTSKEAIGQPVTILMPPDHLDEYPQLMADLKLGKSVDHYETERMTQDGRRIFVSLTLSPLRENGRIVGASIIARDITEQKRALTELALSEERYRSLVAVSSQIVWTTKPNGEVEDMPMWRAFTGQTAEEVKGRGWIDALHPEDRERTVDVWQRAVKNLRFYDTEFRMRRHDGGYRDMAVHGVPVLESSGAIREWVGACADITDRKQAEEEIRRLNQELEARVVERTAQWEASNRELEAFAYSVSHDLRAPLRAVDGFSRILIEEHTSTLPEEAQRYLDIVRQNAVQMGELIDDLLAFSRLNRQAMNKQAVDMRALVSRALDDLAREQEGRQIEIVVGELPPCEADMALLKQVLVNLLSNALKYTRRRDPARIEVGVVGRPDSSYAQPAVYFVRDNGAGFDMRYADKLFGVFQRLHRAEEYEGTGVGLALVHRIITRHGGKVWAEAAVDRGATFYFTLEAVAGLRSSESSAPAPPESQSHRMNA